VTDSLWQRVGGTELPLDAARITGAATFEPADPALAVLAELFAAALRGELGTGTTSAWYAVTSSLPDKHRLNCSENPVGTIWRVGQDGPAGALLRQVKVGTWPLLCVWRTGDGEWEQITFTRAGVRQKWTAAWILGDYEADLALKLGPVLTLAGKAMGAVIVNGGRHPGYDSDTQQFGEARGWLSTIRPVSFGAGAASFSDDEETRFWSASSVFESLELIRDLDEFDNEGGETTSLGVTANCGDGEELVPAMVVGDGDFPGT
jgi:hypothetical protein